MPSSTTVARASESPAATAAPVTAPTTARPHVQANPTTSSWLHSAAPTVRLSDTQTSSSSASGQPLLPSTRSVLESSYQTNLSSVRVHTDTQAFNLSQNLGARAVTYGNHIFLGPGERSTDLRLMAHETAHVVQQSYAPAVQLWAPGESDHFEHEAHAAADAVMHGEAFNVQQRTTQPQTLGWGLSPLDFIADKANMIPGFRMFTIVLGMNPINGAGVDRSAANILRAVIEFMPGGGLITQALDNSGVFEKAGAFVEKQIAALGLVGASIMTAVKDFIKSLGAKDLLNLGGAWERAKRIFTEPIDRLKSFVKGLVGGIIQLIKDAILKPIAKLAEGTEGYNLLKGILGKDPITGEAVPRSAETLLGPLLKMIGLGDVWEKMQQAKAIPRCWAWFQSTMSQLLGFVSQIPGLFIAAFKALTIEDIILVPKAFAKLASVFGGFLGKFVSWGVDAMFKLLEIVFDVVSPGAFAHIKKTGAALKSILKNPLPFIGNLVKAAKLGFTNFAGNILTHLKKGLIDWLTGSLEGVYIPKALSLVEFGKLALSILGISWAQIRAKIVKALGPSGETIMKGLEGAFDVIKALVTGGPAAAWEVIKDKLSSLKDTIVQGIISFVIESIVTKAVPKLIAMFIPGAGFISAIISIYDTVMVFVQKISKIAQAVSAFINSIVQIAAGNIGAAASKVESVLGSLLSLAISFLAGFVGLGKVTGKVMEVINKVRSVVDKALDTAIGFIIGKAKALFAKLFGRGDKDKGPETRTDEQKLADLKKAVAEGQTIASDKSTSKGKKQKALQRLKSTYKLTTIELVSDSQSKAKENVHVRATINPTFDGAGFIIDRFPPEPVVVIDAMVGAPIPREGMEKVLPTRKGYERAHLLGPGLGADMPQGILYAPSVVNQKLQNQGIEHLIRAMYAQKYPGAEFRVVLTATPHPGGDLLARANYKLYGRFPGEAWTFIFEYTIKVGLGASPSVKVLAGEPADMAAVHRFSAGAASVIATRGQ